MPENSPTAPGDETIGRLRDEVSDHAKGGVGMSKSAREEGHDPSAVEEEQAGDETLGKVA